MERQFQLLLLLIITILTLSCTGRNSDKKLFSAKSDNNVIKVDLDKNSILSIKDLYSFIELIPLETNNKSIIKEVSKLIYFEDNYYILDEKQYALLIFDSSGRFLNKIQNIGNGPGEYSLLYDFNINCNSKSIELLNPRGELLEYSKIGTFIKSIKIPLTSTSKFTYLTDDIILFYSLYGRYKLSFFSRSQDSIISQIYEFPDFILKTPLISVKSSPFNREDSIVTFFQGFSNDVYIINGTKLNPKLTWDFGKHNFNFLELPGEKPINYYPNYLRGSNFAHSFNYYIENKRYIYTRFMFDKIWHTIIFDKVEQKYYLIKKFKELISPPAFPVFFDKGILTSAEQNQIPILVNENILDQTNKNIFNNLKLEDNPVIIKYYFRKN